MNKIPDLEERFLEPEGWRWHSFKRQSKHGERTLRFGTVSPKDSVPHATIICLPGLSEFGEKYFETARWALENNFSFWVLDWCGQGRSSRYLKNPHTRHAYDFQDDVDDLKYFIEGYVKHASVATDVGRVPFVMLAHSMGGNIGTHFMSQNPDFFACSIMSAPLFKVKDFDPYPNFSVRMLSGALNLIAGKSYAFGAGDWSEDTGLRPEELSSDPVRGLIMKKWFLSDPDLQVGFVTFGWVDAALRSCIKLLKKDYLKNIQTHCTLVKAEKDSLVSNKAIDHVHSLFKQAELIELADAKHEILMESDPIRNQFLDIVHKSIQEHVINNPESLKTF